MRAVPRWRSRLIAVVIAVGFCALPSTAAAFDTGPHADLMRDALTAEGFSRAAGDVGMVDNWFVDYYTNPDKNPYSGHASSLIGVTRLGLARENWLNQWVSGARHLHFDYELHDLDHPRLGTTAGIGEEWQRLMYLTRQWTRYAGQHNDPYRLMAVMGISLHAVQDFYAHSNWVEDLVATPGLGGPALASRGYGNAATWFDVPPDVRSSLKIYTGVKGIPRGHGHWRSNDNKSLKEGLNKDWPGRPKYQQAYMSAYFASRQWIRAIHDWLGNEPLWKRAQALADTAALRHDVEGATEISKASGHWQGGGEPCVPFSCGDRTGDAGSVVSLRLAIGAFHDRGPSVYRKAFNELIGAFALFPKEATGLGDLPSSRPYQLTTRFVKLEVTAYGGPGLGDLVGGSDDYMNARIGNQFYTSTVINGRDSFSFGRPYAPATWIRAISTDNRASTPVTSMTVRLETGNRLYSGTDDDVYLRINRNLRFPLEKRAYNDFERGDDDTYSVPLDSALRSGLTIGDIDQVTIEKSPDRLAGGWFLHGVTLVVNGQTLVRNRSIDRWLENNKRSWTASGVPRDHRTSDIVPIWLQIRDDDFGTNDTGDINPYDRVTTQAVAYRPGTNVTRTVVGGDLLKGRLSLDNGDRARLTYRLSTLTVRPPKAPVTAPPPPPPPTPTPPPPTPDPTPPPPSGQPDLLITALGFNTVTVKNQGNAAAGAFNISLPGNGVVRINSLAAGASATATYNTATCSLPVFQAKADSSNEVAESNESNNTSGLTIPIIC
jgi:hypothetical protein